MASINPALVPTIAPGNIFTSFTENTTLNIRWLVPSDPVMYEVLNRPIADVTLRQLILAKAVDNLNLTIGSQATFPFVVTPKLDGTSTVEIPDNWIWDMHISTPAKWENFRLAKIKRMSGDNATSYTGVLRLIFTATQENSSIETAIFSADYTIDSILTYQRSRIRIVDSTDSESTYISPSESETVDGFITFRTLDVENSSVITFLDVVVPGSTTDSNSDGYYDSPESYELLDTAGGTSAETGDFSLGALSHGTGLLTDQVQNAIPSLDSDVQSWISAFNYPFDTSANLVASGTYGVELPAGLFREFDISAPAGDEPTGDTSGTFYPVWVNKVQITDTAGDSMRWYFATYNVTDTDPDPTAVEFGYLDLTKTMSEGDILPIISTGNLKLESGTDSSMFNQHFGRGHVVLSSVWSGTSSTITDFFDAFDPIPGPNAEVEFTVSNTRLSSYAVSRSSKYIPTKGENQALVGSSSRFTVPLNPSSDNLYVTELDQGVGNQIDLESYTSITSHAAISRYGNSGSLAHKIISLCVDNSQLPTSSSDDFYTTHLLPRLTILLGRAPVFGDFWYNGISLLFFNGDVWVGL